MHKDTEAEALQTLVIDARSGNHAAMERLLRASYPRLLRQASGLMRDRDAAQDVVQETLVKLARNIGQLQAAPAFASWSQTILKREAIVFMRRRKKSLGESLEPDDIRLDPGNADPIPSLLRRDEIEHCLRGLPQADRTLLRLHYWRELEIREIAQSLGVAAGAVKVRLYRARQRLRALLNAPEPVPIAPH